MTFEKNGTFEKFGPISKIMIIIIIITMITPTFVALEHQRS